MSELILASTQNSTAIVSVRAFLNQPSYQNRAMKTSMDIIVSTVTKAKGVKNDAVFTPGTKVLLRHEEQLFFTGEAHPESFKMAFKKQLTMSGSTLNKQLNSVRAPKVIRFH